jgi:hypothetical protein
MNQQLSFQWVKAAPVCGYEPQWLVMAAGICRPGAFLAARSHVGGATWCMFAASVPPDRLPDSEITRGEG